MDRNVLQKEEGGGGGFGMNKMGAFSGDLVGTELGLGNSLAHGSGRGDTTGDGLDQVVVVVGTGPVLVSEGLDTVVALLALDAVDVGEHAFFGELAGKHVDAQGVAVEAGKGDELPGEAQGAQVADEGAHVVVGHASSVPVEGGRQVVGEHDVGVLGEDTLGELGGLGQDGGLGLHPEEVRVRSEGDSSRRE
jgi:hypothetical protein